MRHLKTFEKFNYESINEEENWLKNTLLTGAIALSSLFGLKAQDSPMTSFLNANPQNVKTEIKGDTYTVTRDDTRNFTVDTRKFGGNMYTDQLEIKKDGENYKLSYTQYPVVDGKGKLRSAPLSLEEEGFEKNITPEYTEFTKTIKKGDTGYNEVEELIKKCKK